MLSRCRPYFDRQPMLCSSTPRVIIALYVIHCDVDILTGQASFTPQQTLLFIAAGGLHSDVDCDQDDATALPIMRTLIALGANVDGECIYNGRPLISPLCAAVMRNRVHRAQLLLENGARMHGLIHVAVRARASPEMIALLAQYGTDLDAQDDDHRTGMHLAVRRRDVPLLQALYDMGANVNIKDKNGMKPLMEACRRRVTDESDYDNDDDEGGDDEGASVRVVEALLRMRIIDVGARDHKGRTALDIARREGNPAVKALIRRAMGRPMKPGCCVVS